MVEEMIFIGENGSMGLRTGAAYMLIVLIDRFRVSVRVNGRWIPYSSLGAFLDNWRLRGR